MHCVVFTIAELPPPSLSLSLPQAQAYFKALPAAKTPVRGTPGEKYHQKQLIRQLPAHDVDVFYCNELTEEETKQMELFLKMRKDKCVAKGEVQTKKEGDHVAWVSHDVFTIGYLVIYALQSSVCYLVHCNIFLLLQKCEKCRVPIKTGEVAVVSGRAGPRACWHPACFTCFDCNELLVDLIYFYHSGDGKVYCGRHHAEKVKPRCAACDEVHLLCT